MSFLTALRQANRLRNAQWDVDKKITPLFVLAELNGEVGELTNVLKKVMRRALQLKGSIATREDVEDEFGDVLICLDRLADVYNVNLETVTRKKFNKTSLKHGFLIYMDDYNLVTTDEVRDLREENARLEKRIAELEKKS